MPWERQELVEMQNVRMDEASELAKTYENWAWTRMCQDRHEVDCKLSLSYTQPTDLDLNPPMLLSQDSGETTFSLTLTQLKDLHGLLDRVKLAVGSTD